MLPTSDQRKAMVVFASTHGQTREIAHRITRALNGEGIVATAVDVGSAAQLAPGDFDLVIVGGSIHLGHHQRQLVNWAQRHHVELNATPSAFFSVSLGAVDETEAASRATREQISEFAAASRWTPGASTAFAGALRYLNYGIFTRTGMRLLMRRGHHPTDVAQNYDYTDWDAVDRFARECSALIPVTPER